jgi:NTP pyrophosphatase (non-canonical NTP hydrolase)
LDIKELQEIAIRLRESYDDLNLRESGRIWTHEEIMLGFVGDVGDLAKLVVAEEGVRSLPGGREALEHEIADCLWSLLILADRYDVDLAAVFNRMVAELDLKLAARRAQAD